MGNKTKYSKQVVDRICGFIASGLNYQQAAAAGAKDWRAHVEFLRLSFAEYRFGNSQQVNVAIQQNMAVSDPERAQLIDELEKTRARALADKPVAPLQLADKSGASDARLQEPAAPVAKRLREHPPKTVVERADWREERRQWAGRDEVDEILDY